MSDPCQRVHAAVRRGEPLDPSLDEHVGTCPACAAVVEGGASLAAALCADERSASPSLDGLWAGIDAEVQQERGPVAWLRSLRTPVRVALVIAIAGLVPLGVALAWTRVDLGVYPSARLALDVGVLAVPAALVLVVAMRPLHRRAWPRWVGPLVVALAVLGVLVGPLLAPAHQAHPASLGGTGEQLVPRAMACLVTGTVLGLPLLLWLSMVLRHRGRFGLPIGVVVVLAGMVGTLSIVLHCPLVAPVHLLAGHATVLGVYLVVAALAGGWRRSR